MAVFLRSKAPPEAARLLPESDGIVYINLKPIRAFLHKDLKPPQRVPEYQQFVDATGIDWERDLDQVAIALHRMTDPNGPNGPVAYSMVLEGKLTGKRLNAWLEAHAAIARDLRRQNHLQHSVGGPHRARGADRLRHGGRLQHPTPEQIHSIIDRHRTAALPFAGSSLLAAHYHEVPLLSLAWGVGQIGLPFSESGAIRIFGLFAAAGGRLDHHRQPGAGAARAPARCDCKWKRLRPPRKRPPARQRLWPRWYAGPRRNRSAGQQQPPTTA